MYLNTPIVARKIFRALVPKMALAGKHHGHTPAAWFRRVDRVSIPREEVSSDAMVG